MPVENQAVALVAAPENIGGLAPFIWLVKTIPGDEDAGNSLLSGDGGKGGCPHFELMTGFRPGMILHPGGMYQLGLAHKSIGTNMRINVERR